MCEYSNHLSAVISEHFSNLAYILYFEGIRFHPRIIYHHSIWNLKGNFLYRDIYTGNKVTEKYQVGAGNTKIPHVKIGGIDDWQTHLADKTKN